MARKHPPDDPAPATPPLGTSTSTSTETGEIDPSHFGIYEFKPGLREELIRAEKPRLDPKLFVDTVPPNGKPVVTEPERIATTPRGGFVAPKPAVTTDRDAPALIAPPTAKAALPVAAPPSVPPSTPPIDTSHSQDVIPTNGRKGTYIRLVAGVAIVAFIIICVALIRMGAGDPTANAAEHAASEGKAPRETTSVTPPPVVQPQVEGVDRAPNAAATGTAPPSPAPARSVPSTRRNVLDAAIPARPATAATPQASSKPAPASPKIRPEFDPGKPWSED